MKVGRRNPALSLHGKKKIKKHYSPHDRKGAWKTESVSRAKAILKGLLYLINEILVERIYNDYFPHLDVISN